MGGATIWPVPRAIDAEAHYYPRKWKRNYLFLYGGMFLTGIQIQRYCHLHRVSTPNNHKMNNKRFKLLLFPLPLSSDLLTFDMMLLFIAINDAHRRIHGLGKQRCPETHQVRLRV